MKIPESIRRIIGDKSYTADNTGLSGASVLCFDEMVLKSGVTEAEYSMLGWMSGRVPVPQVIAYEDGWLLMTRIHGMMLCEDRIVDDPKLLTELMAEGLHMLWDADIDGCPIACALDYELSLAEERVAAGMCSMTEVEPGTYGKGGFESPEQLYRWLCDNRPAETPVLSHVDFCLPNIFTDGKHITGFIDTGCAGVSDPYRDISLGYRSFRNNYDGVYASRRREPIDYDMLFSALGMTPDREKLRYYLLLDELF